MATEIKTWQIVEGELKSIDSSLVSEGRSEAYDLESWIATNPIILGQEIVIIGRQVQTQSGPLDLLGIDRSGNTVIIELKRDKLPREVMAQAVDYASDVASWSIEKIGEECAKYTDNSLEDVFSEQFPEVNTEDIAVNESQRIILVGFSVESALERMINWLSSSYDMSINAMVLKYVKTVSGDELLIKTSIISEEVEKKKVRKRKSFNFQMSDKPGEYEVEELNTLLARYFSQKNHQSAMLIRTVIIPTCFKNGTITRNELKELFVEKGFAEDARKAGQYLSIISQQMGLKKNDFLRQVISYGYPNYPWEKDNYSVVPEYAHLVKEVIQSIKDWD
ncbi:MAG: DUF91 domain-containing protein [Anaerolineales bacterium]|nr:DUF91 domain-containing protein [Anaerolineales bacterium]